MLALSSRISFASRRVTAFLSFDWIWLPFDLVALLCCAALLYRTSLRSVARSARQVDFKGPPLPIESLFNLFRPYGRLVDIQPSSDGKSAKIIYLRATSAVSAQNCLLGYKEGETTLSVEYMDPDIVGKWMSWFQKNTRLAILLAGALVALISFLILEPTRRFLIANKVTKTYTPTGLFKYIYSLLRLHTTFSFLRPRGPNLASEGLEEVRAYADRIIESCKNVPDTFVFIIGPKGSGKATLVRQLQDHASYDLSLDMDAIQSQSSDALVLRQLTKQIGYWPQFTFFARFNAMADALIQATTGTAAGLSSTPQQDFKGFLETATVALKQIVADQVAANAKLEAQGKPTKMVEYPVIIINGFAGKERANGKNGWTNDLVAEWAATLIENKVANVVFTTKNPRSVRVAAKCGFTWTRRGTLDQVAS